MSKSSTQIAINFPNELLAIFDEHLNRKFFRDFVREAVAEKLKRNFDVNIPSQMINRKKGERSDLHNYTPEKHEKMKQQAAHARATKQKIRENVPRTGLSHKS